MIAVRLREAMEAYRERTGHRITYDQLAERTGLSRDTIQSIASRPGYGTTLESIERLALALGCTDIGDLLRLVVDHSDGEGQ